METTSSAIRSKKTREERDLRCIRLEMGRKKHRKRRKEIRETDIGTRERKEKMNQSNRSRDV